MSNIVKNPTNKLNAFFSELNDFSANVSMQISNEAKQNIVISQTQNIVLKDGILDGCTFEANQNADVIASQLATFKATLSNPKQMLKRLTDGPNSIFGQMFSSNSPVMTGFIDSAKQAFGSNDKAEVRSQLTNIVKININQSVISKAAQSIFVNQSQNFLMSGFSCKNSTIKISQNAIISAFQNVSVSVLMDTLGSNPKFRESIRRFNGDYDPNVLNEQVDASVNIPPVCASDLTPVPRQTPCPPCAECPTCPLCSGGSQSVPQYDDLILSAKLFYITVATSVVLIILSIILKK